MNIIDFDTEIEIRNNEMKALKFAKAHMERIGEWPIHIEASFTYFTMGKYPKVSLHITLYSEENSYNVSDKDKHKLLAWLTKKLNVPFTSFWYDKSLTRLCHIACDVKGFKYDLGLYIDDMPIGKNCTVVEEVRTERVSTLVCPVKEE